jgi:prepilin-type N-terminal cleavage/methylation domain-containing protein/prepilin-type processing-associated H-X9-DG protein
MRRTRNGFSLVELLVVIGIIALLTAILMPVLGHVRRMGRSMVCLAHLCQLDASYQMYLGANRNHSFAFPPDITAPTWYELLQPYNGSVKQMLLCPEATEPGNLMGGAFMGWGPERTYNAGMTPRDEFVGSYGVNNWLFAPPVEQRATMAPSYAQRMIELPTKHGERVPVFGDCIQSWGGPDSMDSVPSDLINPLPYYSGVGPKPQGPTGQMAYFCIDRHFRAINIAFLDGHAERVGLEELWKLRWNNAFKPSNVTVP